jgi:hypothetical protein
MRLPCLAIALPDGIRGDADGQIDQLKSAIGKTIFLANSSDEAGLLARIAEMLRPLAETELVEPRLEFSGYG